MNFAKPLSKFEIIALRDKMKRSLDWAADPQRAEIGDNMTNNEAAAIMLYTQECCLYPRMNSALRSHDLDTLAPFLPFMKLLLTALHKLPLRRVKVYRGIKLDLHEAYNILAGSTFSWWSFSSTTLDLSVLQSPLFLGTEGNRTLFCIDAVGVDIAPFSNMPDEAEILMLPGTRMRIVKPGSNPEEGFWQYDAEVLSPLHGSDTYNEECEPLIDFAHPGWRTRISLNQLQINVEMVAPDSPQ